MIYCVAVLVVLMLGSIYGHYGWVNSRIPTPRTTTRRTSIIAESIPTTYRGRGGGSYMVYDCSQAKPGNCGGWSDRLSGILTTFTVALLTKQRFLINNNSPCPLQDYLVPGQVDWRYNMRILSNRTSKYYNFMNSNSGKIRDHFNGKRDLNKFFSHDVNFIRINWDFTEEFRLRPDIFSTVPWIKTLDYADIYKELLNFLFTPSALLLNELTAMNRTRMKTACAHIRHGRSFNMPKDIVRKRQPLDTLWTFMDKLDKDVYDIFIAADNDYVKKLAKNRYPDNIIDTTGDIVHLDKSLSNTKLNPRNGFLKVLLDFYTLASCDILIIQNSGFGIMASYLRNGDSGLYCWKEGKIKPCTRRTIPIEYPHPILAPDRNRKPKLPLTNLDVNPLDHTPSMS